MSDGAQRRTRRGQTRSQAEKPPMTPSASATAVLDQAKEFAKEWHLPEAAEKLGEFLSALGDDIKESPPRALIAAFLAGFVAGKVVGR